MVGRVQKPFGEEEGVRDAGSLTKSLATHIAGKLSALCLFDEAQWALSHATSECTTSYSYHLDD